MSCIVLQQMTVSDYARFKPIFDEDGHRRERLGSRGGRLLRSASNPGEYVAILEWDDLEKARTFANSLELREAAEWAGVVGLVKTMVLEEVEPVKA